MLPWICTLCALNHVCAAHLGMYTWVMCTGVAVHSISVVSRSIFRFILCVSQCACVLWASPCLCAVVCFFLCGLLCLLNVAGTLATQVAGAGGEAWSEGGAIDGCSGLCKLQAR